MSAARTTRWRSPRRRTIGAAAAFVVVALLCGCSSFERDWREQGPESRHHDTLRGRWEGRWTCEQTGHEGALRCLVSQVGPDEYEMHYLASWSGFESEYRLQMTMTPAGGFHTFSGDYDLGFWFGGECRFEGHATPTEWVTNYSSDDNRGQFILHRPGRSPRP